MKEKNILAKSEKIDKEMSEGTTDKIYQYLKTAVWPSQSDPSKATTRDLYMEMTGKVFIGFLIEEGMKTPNLPVYPEDSKGDKNLEIAKMLVQKINEIKQQEAKKLGRKI